MQQNHELKNRLADLCAYGSNPGDNASTEAKAGAILASILHKLDDGSPTYTSCYHFDPLFDQIKVLHK